MDSLPSFVLPQRLSVDIHPSACVSPAARLGVGVEIGPFCVVGADVEIGDQTRLISHVVVDGVTRIGAGTTVFPFATIGLAPQDLKYRGEPTRTEVGDRTQIREHVTIHRGTATGRGVTSVGSDCMLMAVAHVAHDCRIGDGVIIANNVVMGGHVAIGDNAVIGGAAAIHQFVRIGRAAMIGGVSGVEADVIPFGMVMGNRARLVGLNIVGLRRRGFDKAEIQVLRAVFRALFAGSGVFAQRLEAARAAQAGSALVAELLEFIGTTSKRGLMLSEIADESLADEA